jgi:hydroxymethylglutaryl-CoA synthase
MSGIIGYGSYIPSYRIKTCEIAKVWGEEAARIEKGLGIQEKAVGGVDEDAATISVEAGRNAIARANVSPDKIGAVYVGSESHPYAVKPTATIVAEAIGATPNLTAADLEFACKAGTAALQMLMGMVDSKMIEYGLAVGADTAQGRPGDALEYSAGSGGAAFIIGPDSEAVAKIEHTFMLIIHLTEEGSQDLLLILSMFLEQQKDFWRKSGHHWMIMIILFSISQMQSFH